jgi:hypothetical protein
MPEMDGQNPPAIFGPPHAVGLGIVASRASTALPMSFHLISHTASDFS